LNKRLKLLYSSEANIWRLKLAQKEPVVALELRNEGQHQVSFAVVDLNLQKVIVQNILFEEQWWVTLKDIVGRYLVLQTFSDYNNPANHNTLVFDYSESQLIMQIEDASYESFAGNKALRLTSVQEGETKNYVYDLETGDELTTPLPKMKEPKAKLPDFPQFYSPDHAYFDMVRTFCKQKLNIEIVQGCDYLEFKEGLIISYYCKSEQFLKNELVIINSGFEIVFREELGDQLDGISEDTFFILYNKLFFIKERKQLFSYEL